MSRRLAFLGPAGTHTEQACLSYDPEATRIPFVSIPQAAAAVDSGVADECVVPIENSLEGSVNPTLDLLIHESKLSMRHELVLPIKNCLVAGSGTEIEDITVVYSHPQALAQCHSFLEDRLPNAEQVASMSTSAAVEEMQKRGREAAAISAERASSLYGAVILAQGIDDNPNNMTRFVVLAPSDHPPTGADKTSLCFSFDEDAPGALHSALGEFATRGINLTKIESRPDKQKLGRYIFLVDLEGHRQDAIVQEALSQVKSQVSVFKIFGSYPQYGLPQTRSG